MCPVSPSSAKNWREISEASEPRLCRILHPDFREFPFYALRCISARKRAGASESRPESARSRTPNPLERSRPDDGLLRRSWSALGATAAPPPPATPPRPSALPSGLRRSALLARRHAASGATQTDEPARAAQQTPTLALGGEVLAYLAKLHGELIVVLADAV